MRRRSGLLGMLLTLTLLVSLAVPAFADMPIPHSFYGMVTIGGLPAPVDTEITAVVEGGGGSYITTVEGQYGSADPSDFDYLVVSGEIEQFALIEFYVDGVQAEETAEFRQGRVTELDLTIEIAPPVVTTNDATVVTTDSATLNGSLDDLGDYGSVDVSFEWGTTSGALDQETTPETKTSLGAFSAGISDLDSNTTYYFRAKATGSITVYGDELSFTTLEMEPPVVTTNDATDVTTDSATLNGSLDDLGDYGSVDISFEWGTTSEALDQETTPETKTSLGAFSAPISDLDLNTTYYFRAKATGSITVYGDELSFTTPEVIPGDANGDGVVNVLDITKVARIILELDAETPGADANGDGEVNVLDITKIARIILELD